MSEKPVHLHPRRLADWLNPTDAKKVHSLIDKVYQRKNLEIAWDRVQANRGKPWRKPRFVQQGEVIVHRMTALAWRRIADLTGRLVCWMDALRAVQQLNERQPGAGWRLPNINELESLVDCRMYAPALPVDAVFTDLHDGYWSSTTSVYERRLGVGALSGQRGSGCRSEERRLLSCMGGEQLHIVRLKRRQWPVTR